MAKIRVYELARDLNMKNKALLEKLSEMDISVRSHMSSLDDDTVKKIKEDVLGKKTQSVEEKRVKPTVIRRRKKTVQKQMPKTPPEEHPKDEPEAVPSREEPLVPEEKAQKVEKKSAVTQETEKPEKEAAKADTKEEPQMSPPDAQLKEKVEVSAETTEKKDADVSDKSPEIPQQKTEIKDKWQEEPVVKEPPMSAPKENQKTAKGKKVSETSKTKPQGQKQEKASTHKPGKDRKRKAKKETPARIIKLPQHAEEHTDKKGKTEKPAATQGADPAATETEAVSKPDTGETKPEKETPAGDKRKKKWRKTPEEEAGETKDKKFFKKKISFKKKEVVEGEDLYDKGQRTRKSRKGGKTKPQQPQKPQITTPKAIKRRIKIDETIILSDLAKRMGIKANEMIKKLMSLGVMATVNQTIDFETAALVAAEFEYEVEKASFKEEEMLKTAESVDTDPDKLVYRPPVVTIMGHVDHGKTSLLDVIRETKITEYEAGGITQHIGAYNVTTQNGQIVFLDTPGHEAFTAMRARGAKVTDIVVLVVAADDGVMPQTVEAINHAKAAGVPIIVAINKIDKANADTDRVYRELSEQGLVPEDWGGDTIFVKVSAKQKMGIEDLLEMILLQSEVLELKANPDKLAIGYVVESQLDAGRGPIATILVQQGTLHSGDPVVCGVHHGKIRAMFDDMGVQVESAGPSMPVEILGLSGVPNSGEELIALTDEKNAKQVSEYRTQKQRSKELAKTSRLSLDKLFEKMKEGDVKELNIILKADVHGSIEALADSLIKLSNEEVTIHVIHSATGTVSESDINLAAVSDAIIIGFNVRPSAKITQLAQDEHVDMRFYDVIYNVIKDIKDAIVGLMQSTYKEHVLGRADVREVFQVPKVGAVAGCYVTDGKLQRGQNARLLRDGVIIYDGKIGSLRRFKDDVKEVQSGYECGVGIENYNDIKQGDQIECYYLEEIRPEI